MVDSGPRPPTIPTVVICLPLPWRSIFEALLYAGTRELAERVLSHPLRGRAAGAREAPGHTDRGRIERTIALTDGAQRHVRGLLDEVALVDSLALDQGEATEERVVACCLVVHGEAP